MNKQDIQTVLDALKTSAHYLIGYSEHREAAITICEAALAEPEGEPSTVLRLIDTIKYLVGIAERGEGRKARDDELPEQFVLGYVKRLEAALAEQSEPVARVMYDDDGIKTNNLIDCDLPVGTLLFTHPASKPEKLTDTEINNIADTNSHVGDVAYMHLQEFARAIEQAVLGKCRG